MILFQHALSLLYIASPRFLSILAISGSLRRHIFPSSQGSSPKAFLCYRAYFLTDIKTAGPLPGPPLSAASIFFLPAGPYQPPGPGSHLARSPLALDHDTDDLFICLFHSVLGKTAHVLDGILHTLLYDTVAAIELLAIDVHIVA